MKVVSKEDFDTVTAMCLNAQDALKIAVETLIRIKRRKHKIDAAYVAADALLDIDAIFRKSNSPA